MKEWMNDGLKGWGVSFILFYLYGLADNRTINIFGILGISFVVGVVGGVIGGKFINKVYGAYLLSILLTIIVPYFQ